MHCFCRVNVHCHYMVPGYVTVITTECESGGHTLLIALWTCIATTGCRGNRCHYRILRWWTCITIVTTVLPLPQQDAGIHCRMSGSPLPLHSRIHDHNCHYRMPGSPLPLQDAGITIAITGCRGHLCHFRMPGSPLPLKNAGITIATTGCRDHHCH